jgi:hypothetical protein
MHSFTNLNNGDRATSRPESFFKVTDKIMLPLPAATETSALRSYGSDAMVYGLALRHGMKTCEEEAVKELVDIRKKVRHQCTAWAPLNSARCPTWQSMRTLTFHPALSYRWKVNIRAASF